MVPLGNPEAFLLFVAIFCNILIPFASQTMVSKQPLTDQALVNLLEKQRCNFTHRYRLLRAAQAIALSKVYNILAAVPESLNRNSGKKKANRILIDIKNCIGNDVFVLCALATSPSSLGSSKLNDYISTVEL